MFKRFTILISTGLPGFIRLIVFLIVESQFNIIDFGDFSNDLSLVQLVSFFTAVGWAALVMTSVSQSTEPERALFKVINTGIVYLILFSVVNYFLYQLGIIKNIFGTICFTASWMLYQITRHYLVVDKKFVRIILFDVFNLLLFLSVLFVGFMPLFALSLSHLVFAVLNLPDFKYYDFSLVSNKLQLDGLKAGLSNFLLGLGVYSLPIILGLVLGAEYSALMGLSTSLLIMIHLVPRAISSYFLPTISKVLITDKLRAYTIHKKQVFYTMVTTVILTALGAIFIILMHNLKFFEVTTVDSAFILTLLLLLNIVVTVITLPYSDLLMSSGNFKVNLEGSYIYSLIVSASLSLFLIYGQSTSHAALLMCAYLLSGFIRFTYIFNNASKILNVHKRELSIV